MKQDKIIVSTPAGNEVEFTSCPFFGCKLDPEIKCMFGATEITVPDNCPLYLSGVVVNVKKND